MCDAVSTARGGAAMIDADLDSRRRARLGLTVYLAVLVALSAIADTALISTHEPTDLHLGLVFFLMCSPAMASMVARLALREGIRDVSFRFGGTNGGRALITAWLFPIIVGGLAYGTAWATHLAQFQRPIAPDTAAPYSPHALVNVFLSLAFMATVGTAINGAAAAGEEIGWRGYMLTRLIDAGVPRPVLISGLIWGTWHVPLIVSGVYASGSHPLISAVLFLVGINAAGYLTAYVRLRSGSIWPAVLFHATWNAVIPGTFDRATVGQPLAVGESGYLVAIVSILVAAWTVRGKWTMLRLPERPMQAHLAPIRQPHLEA
jgi:membrane protease YdiL (CAAX protease family)